MLAKWAAFGWVLETILVKRKVILATHRMGYVDKKVRIANCCT